jgi:hypothetical protein
MRNVMQSLALLGVKLWVTQKLPTIIALVTSLSALGAATYHSEIKPYLADPTGVKLFVTIILLVLLIAFSSGLYFWHKKTLKPLSWGVHQNIKTGEYFCSTCFIQNKIYSPMFLSANNRFWACHCISDHKRENINYIKPLVGTPNYGKNGWMR